MRAGFVGRPDLAIELPPGPRGGPVFDGFGRLVGLAVAGSPGRDRLLPVSVLEKYLGEAPPAAPPQRVAVDEIYERALGIALQVIAAR